MGLWKNIRGIFDPNALVEATIEAQVNMVLTIRRMQPERDMNAWLAGALQNRVGWKGKAEIAYFTQTALFSVLSADSAPVALGYFVSIAENRQLEQQLDLPFGSLMAPALRLRQEGGFAREWRRLNPWTATHHPHVVAGVEGAATLRI